MQRAQTLLRRLLPPSILPKPRAPNSALDAWRPARLPVTADGTSIEEAMCAAYDVSRDMVRILLARGKVALERGTEKRVVPRRSTALRAGDVLVMDEFRLPLRHNVEADAAERARHMVLYADGDVLVLNKPAGLDLRGPAGTRLLDALRMGSKHAPTPITMLDPETSGAVVLARTPEAASKLRKAASASGIASRAVQVYYWALVAGGKPPRDRLRMRITSLLYVRRPGVPLLTFAHVPYIDLSKYLPAGENAVASNPGHEAEHGTSEGEANGMAKPNQPNDGAPNSTEQAAYTSFADLRRDLLDEGEVAVSAVRWLQAHRSPGRRVTGIRSCKRRRYSLVEVRPFTGRAHQVRVHLAEQAGTPVLGDYVYGAAAQPLAGMADLVGAGVRPGGWRSADAQPWMSRAQRDGLRSRAAALAAAAARDIPLHLHASKVVLNVSGRRVVVKAPMPRHMVRTMHANPLVLRDLPSFVRRRRLRL